MKAPLYTEILQLCEAIAKASASDDEKARVVAHQGLQKLCQSNQGSAKDHPLQWEALADFTHDGDQALDIYQLALNSAKKLNLPESKASIYLAIAQRYAEFEEPEKTLSSAKQAEQLIPLLKSDELKTEIKQFLNTLSSSL